MSETPTNYDLVQDARIGPMESILSQAAEPPTGDEYSYPIVGQGWSTDMWRWMTRGIGNGILYAGGHPYALGNIDNNAQTVQVLVSSTEGTANAIIDGFFHELRANKTFALPMPSSGATTYTIALTFDPRREKDAEGPIRIEVHTGAPPTTFGRKHIVLWEVTRRANELLSNADMVEGRQGVSPFINANSAAVLPDANTVLSGTIAVTSPISGPEFHFARHYSNPDRNQWISLSDPEWEERLDATYEWAGHGHRPATQKKGKTVRLRGRVAIRNGNNFDRGQNGGNGYRVMWLPERLRPATSTSQTTSMGARLAPGTADVWVESSGDVLVYVSGTTRWVSLDGIIFDTE